MSRRNSKLIALAVLTAFGCDENAQEPRAQVDITFVFASEGQEAASANAHAWVLASRDGVTSCEDLVSGELDPFDTTFRVLDDVAVVGDALGAAIAFAPAGPVIVYAEANDHRGELHLAGCTTVEIQLPSTAVTVELRPVGIVECDEPGVIDGARCDDGDLCTVADTCTGGSCEGRARNCSALDTQCNAGSCVDGVGCVATPRPDGTSCDDGIGCTTGDECTAGLCAGGDFSACCPGPDCIEFDCTNGMDEDGDFDFDCDDFDCDAHPLCNPPEFCSNFFDDDRDGEVDCDDPDCANLVVCAGCTAGSCPDANLGSVLRTDAAVGDVSDSCDRRTPSCSAAGAADVSYAWRAPRAGNYRFTAQNFYGALEVSAGCTGASLSCDFADLPTALVTLTANQDVVITLDSGGIGFDQYRLDIRAVPSSEVGLCNDNIDNDEDLDEDCQDTDCAADPVCIESDCGNFIDDDGDFVTDCRDDDCVGSSDCEEVGLCGNGLDDDGDGQDDCSDSECGCSFECTFSGCPDRTVTSTTTLPFSASISSSGCNEWVGSCIAGRSNAPDYTILYTPATSGSYTFSVTSTTTTFDSAVYVLATNMCGGTGATEVAGGCNETTGSNNSSVTVNLVTGTSYIVVVDGVGVSGGSFSFNVTTP
jgi:hypothetical protein